MTTALSEDDGYSIPKFTPLEIDEWLIENIERGKEQVAKQARRKRVFEDDGHGAWTEDDQDVFDGIRVKTGILVSIKGMFDELFPHDKDLEAEFFRAVGYTKGIPEVAA